jgi:MFS family permease
MPMTPPATETPTPELRPAAGSPPAARPDTRTARPRPEPRRLGASLLAALAGVLVALGTFVVLAVLLAASGLAIGVPMGLAPGDWRQLETVVAGAVALGAFVAYLFGGYVAARLGGHDGLHHGVRVFALGLSTLAALGLLGMAMLGPASVDAHLHAQAAPTTPAAGIQVGTVAVKTTIWSILAMLAGSVSGGILGGRADRVEPEA